MEMIYCIPLNSSKDTFAKQLYEESLGKFKLINERIFNLENGIFFEIEVGSKISNLRESFYYSSNGEFDKPFLDRIEAHQLILYLFSKPENLNHSIELVYTILKTNGIAVKNEIIGRSYTFNDWSELFHNITNQHIFDFFTNVIVDEDNTYTIGMNFFELPDIQIETGEPSNEDLKILYEVSNKIFLDNKKELITKKYFNDLKEDTRFEKDDLSYNPYGIITI